MRINDVRPSDHFDNELLKFDNANVLNVIVNNKTSSIDLFDSAGIIKQVSVPIEYVVKLALERVKEIKAERQG